MSIRPVTPADREEWLRMLCALYPPYPPEEHAPDVDGFLAGVPAGQPTTAAVFVSERADGGLNGFLELSVRDYAEGCDGPTPYVESWYVDADVRRKGVGRALLAAAEAWARERGYRELASDTELVNRTSERAHLAFGFREVERTIHFRKAL
jgi:aminoglycoside 6'-N-acetyltransferase I